MTKNMNGTIYLNEKDLVFAKVKPNAIIPTKDKENAGRDVYACFEEDYMIIPAHTTKLIPTGIASAMSSKYEIRLRDRGSNGSKGIHVNAGTIDSNFRGEWFVAWCNTNDNPVILSKLSIEELIEKHGVKDSIFGDVWLNAEINLSEEIDEYKPVIYPYSKAIAQAEVCEVPVMKQIELSYEELCQIPSNRGTGCLGSSGK